MSKTCKACRTWKSREGYDRFLADHKCAINFEGSAGAMESTGVVKIFRFLETLHKVRIINFIGDGDSNV